MKRNILYILVIFFVANKIVAGKLVVQNICELTSDITARTKVKLDKNGKECALVRVNIPSIRNIDFKGDIVSSDYLPGEYVLYIPEGTKSIAYSFDGFSNEIDFSLYGIEVKGKSSYRCTMKKETGSPKCKLTVLSEPESAIVIVDGIPKGETPLLLDDLTVGEHVISVPNTTGYTMADMRIVVKEGENQTINLKLVKTEIKGFELETVMYGGDTAGSHWSMYKTVEKNGKYGLVDLLGNVVVPCKYDEIFPELQNGFFVVWDNRKCGLYKPGEGLVVPIQYSSITTKTSDKIIDRFLRVSRNDKCGYIDCYTRKEVVPCIYEHASAFPQDNILLVATRYDLYGYLKIEGNEIRTFIPPTFDRASEFDNGVALVRLKKQTGEVEAILDTKGRVKELPPYYRHSYDCDMGFSEGLCSVIKGGKTGFIDKEGNEVIPCLYGDAVDIFQDWIVMNASSSIGSKGWIILSKTGKVIGLFDDTEIGGKYCIIKNQGKKGIIRSDGEVIIPCEYDKCKFVSGESTVYIAVYEDNICNLYDENVNKIFSCPGNLDIIGFKDGFIMIRDSEAGTYGYANLKGDIIASCIYTMSEDISFMMNTTLATISEGLAMLILGDKYGFIDNTGKVVVPVKYTAAIPFMNGIGYVREGNNWIRIQKSKLLQR